ncbi:MAG: nucleotidyltransferase substrate binding protein [Desulfotomaculum sp.]|nr:nucleotidyltransferase substrate binding protein [Desulfotomaculum sp.]MCL0080654.1 nucleotidyltransferase substrate binding protein [Peptococcaceae bacterium]
MLEKDLQLKNFKKATEKFKIALQYDPVAMDIALDATIQRFEFTFELAWKSIKLVAKIIGHQCKSPKGCLQLAYKMGWIKSEEQWLKLLEARNLTTHTYSNETAMEVYAIIKENAAAFDELLKELAKEI